MTSMKQTKQVEKPFAIIPTVPQDFDGAVAVHKEVVKALVYWKEEKKYANSQSNKTYARQMEQRWERVANESEVVIQSYQLRLF